MTGVLVPEVKGRISELFWEVLSGRRATPYSPIWSSQLTRVSCLPARA